MKYQVYTPCAQLQPYVKHLIISETSNEHTYKVLPDTSLVIGIQYSGRLAYHGNDTPIPLATSGITGLIDSFRIFSNSRHIGTVLIVFTETGAASFFREPLHELFRQSVSLDHFVTVSTLQRLEEQLAEAHTDQQRIVITELFLLSQLRNEPTDRLVRTAIDVIYQTNGMIRIAKLADHLCISQSPLEKRFRQVVGASPKKFATLVRIKHTMKSLALSNNLTDIGLETGYFDQAHFSKEFKAFTGLTPLEFMKTKRSV